MAKAKGEAVVRSVVKGLQERYAKRGGAELIMMASDMETPGSISTGCLGLDLIMGGGVYYGKPVELFGEHSSGKSLVLMQYLREAQRAGAEAVLGDAENSYDKEYGAALGINNSALGYCTAKTVELLTEVLLDCIADVRKRSPDRPIALGIDSLAALTTQHRLDEPLDTADMTKAKMTYGMLAKLRAVLGWGPVALVWINQVRDRIQTGWVPPGMAAKQKGRGKAATAGGKGPPYEAHARVELTREAVIKEGDPPKGREPDARVAVGEFIGAFAEKTRMCPPFNHCMMKHTFGQGLDRTFGLWEAMLRTGRLTCRSSDLLWEVRFGKGEELEFDRRDFEALVDEKPEILRG